MTFTDSAVLSSLHHNTLETATRRSPSGDHCTTPTQAPSYTKDETIPNQPGIGTSFTSRRVCFQCSHKRKMQLLQGLPHKTTLCGASHISTFESRCSSLLLLLGARVRSTCQISDKLGYPCRRVELRSDDAAYGQLRRLYIPRIADCRQSRFIWNNRLQGSLLSPDSSYRRHFHYLL